jgi:hypothetical protein
MQLLNDAAGDAGVAHAAVQMLVQALTDCSADVTRKGGVGVWACVVACL